MRCPGPFSQTRHGGDQTEGQETAGGHAQRQPEIAGKVGQPAGSLEKSEADQLADQHAAGHDGAFLTVGYGRPFPVCDDYQPPFEAPEGLASLVIETGPLPPFDFDAEMAHAMRHQ